MPERRTQPLRLRARAVRPAPWRVAARERSDSGGPARARTPQRVCAHLRVNAGANEAKSDHDPWREKWSRTAPRRKQKTNFAARGRVGLYVSTTILHFD